MADFSAQIGVDGKPHIDKVAPGDFITARGRNELASAVTAIASGMQPGGINTPFGSFRRPLPKITDEQVVQSEFWGWIYAAVNVNGARYAWKYSFVEQIITGVDNDGFPGFANKDDGLSTFDDPSVFAINELEMTNGGRGGKIASGVNTGGGSYPLTWHPQPIGGGATADYQSVMSGTLKSFRTKIRTEVVADVGTFYFFAIGNQHDGACP